MERQHGKVRMKHRLTATAVVAAVSVGLPCAALAGGAAPPSSSPLSQIRQGMRMAAVTDVAGPPTASCTHMTGKAFIPLYVGNDKEITELHYKGQGRVNMSGGGVTPQVISVDYDPTESGNCGGPD